MKSAPNHSVTTISFDLKLIKFSFCFYLKVEWWETQENLFLKLCWNGKKRWWFNHYNLSSAWVGLYRKWWWNDTNLPICHLPVWGGWGDMTDYIIDRERGDGNWLSCYNGFLVTMQIPLIIRLGSIAMQTKAGIGAEGWPLCHVRWLMTGWVIVFVC